MPLRPFPKGVQEASRSPRHIEPLPIWVTWNVPSPWKVGSRMNRSIMSWLKWILAYLFDCVHPHTTWPHQDRAGLAWHTYAASIADERYRIQCNKLKSSPDKNNYKTSLKLLGRTSAGAEERESHLLTSALWRRNGCKFQHWNIFRFLHTPGFAFHVESSPQHSRLRQFFDTSRH